MTDTPMSPPAQAGIILLPSNRFFVRGVPLAEEGSSARQIELAVENRSSFPVNQMYFGYLLSPRRDAALVFAAFRKRFAAKETEAWAEATGVLPSFIALLGQAPASPTIRLWTGAQEIIAVAWDGASPLPVAVLARETGGAGDASQRESLLAEVRARTELAEAGVEEYSGPGSAGDQSRNGQFEIGIAGGAARLFSQEEMETADVRDKEYLAGRQALRKRDALLWRCFQACAAGLALMLAGEAGLLAASARLGGVKQRVQQHAPAVKRIETAQALSRRIEEMTQRRLLPFEMLALINQSRPASIQFMRSATDGLNGLEIEARTADAAAIGQYEAALRARPELGSVETRDLRSREGVTTFGLVIAFKPGSLRQEGAP